MKNLKKNHLLFFLLLIIVSGLLLQANPAVADARTKPAEADKHLKTWLKYQSNIKQNKNRHFFYYIDAAAAAVKAKKYGWAVLCYERARVIDDGVDGVNKNIDLIRKKTGAVKYQADSPFIIKLIFFMYFFLDRFQSINIAFILLLLLINTFTILYWKNKTGNGWIKLVLLVWTMLVFVLIAGYIFKDNNLKSPARAVTVTDRLSFYRTPSQDAEILLQLPEATALHYQFVSRDGRLRVALPGGGSGWVESDGICFINPDNNNGAQ